MVIGRFQCLNPPFQTIQTVEDLYSHWAVINCLQLLQVLSEGRHDDF
jgi:hypothetical protein